MPGRALVATLLLCTAALPADILQHDLELKIDPATGTFESVDRILVRGPAILDLPVVSGIEHEPRPGKWSIPGGKHERTVRYRGKLPAEVGAAKAGAIGPDFVLLRWGFYTAAGACPFKVHITVPLPHRAICQGRRVAESEEGGLYRVTYEAGAHTRRIVVATAPWQVTEETIDTTSCRSYLLREGRELLAPLREALPRARAIFGRVPDGRYDIVEVPVASELACANFSFVGPGPLEPNRLARDLIDVWLRNYVYGDSDRGNWWDGLTDLILAEQETAHRKRIVYRYSLRVPPGQDQPLNSRVWPEREELLHGKSSMVFHMLARRLGRPLFLKALRHAIGTRAGQRLGFAELGAALGEGVERDLTTWLTPWISRAGGPTLETGAIKVSGNRIVGTIVQSQAGPAYPIRVPVRVRTPAGVEEHLVRCGSKESVFIIETKAEPRRLELDPDFHLFRIIPRDRAAPSLDATLTAPRRVGFGDAKILERWKIEPIEPGLPPDAAVLALGLPESVREPLLTLARRQEGSLKFREEGFDFRGKTYDRPGDAILLSFARPQSPGFPVTFFHGDEVPDLEEFGTDGWVIFREGKPIARGDLRGDRPSVAQITSARKGDPDSLVRDLLFLTDARHRGRRAGTNEAYKLANELRGRLFKAGVKVLPWPPVSIPTGRLVGDRKITILDGEEKIPLPQYFFPFHRSASPELPAVFERVVEHPSEEAKDALVLLPEDSSFELAQTYAGKGAAVVAVVSKTPDFRTRGSEALWEGAMPAGAAAADERAVVSAALARATGPRLEVPYIYLHPMGAAELKQRGKGGVVRFRISRAEIATSNVVGVLGPARERGVLLAAPWDGNAASGAAAAAAVLWTAERLKKDHEEGRLKRPVVFALFGGEEMGRSGSRQFVQVLTHPKTPVSKPLLAFEVLAAGGPQLFVGGQPDLHARFEGAKPAALRFSPLREAEIETLTLGCTWQPSLDRIDVSQLRALTRALYRATKEAASR
ncbi:MAG: M28 family peptidase [Planctomycetota bacterium]|jgi:hypothetical protein